MINNIKFGIAAAIVIIGFMFVCMLAGIGWVLRLLYQVIIDCIRNAQEKSEANLNCLVYVTAFSPDEEDQDPEIPILWLGRDKLDGFAGGLAIKHGSEPCHPAQRNAYYLIVEHQGRRVLASCRVNPKLQLLFRSGTETHISDALRDKLGISTTPTVITLKKILFCCPENARTLAFAMSRKDSQTIVNVGVLDDLGLVPSGSEPTLDEKAKREIAAILEKAPLDDE